jgi:hypothetical protein
MRQILLEEVATPLSVIQPKLLWNDMISKIVALFHFAYSSDRI